MNFDTLTVEPECISEVADYAGYKFLTPRAHKWIDKLDLKLIEHYGESIRPKLNHSRAKRGLKPL
jgi:hypothetical protein